MKKTVSFKETLNLPNTKFPMKANLPQREGEFLKNWEEQAIYETLQDHLKSSELFILHDGPPFANGDIHLGHALNKVLKDIIVRYKSFQGYRAPYIPGWDCHGLPIEHKVVQELPDEKKIPIIIRKRSAAYAKKFIDIQRKQFKRLGIIGKWDEPYATLDRTYEAEILRVFAKLVEQNMIYQGLRPVYWSTGCQTALAEAEVEYQDRKDASIYVRFEVDVKTADVFNQLDKKKPVYLAVWTTTPWTLPANLAAAVHPQMKYAVAEYQNEYVVVAKSRFDEFNTKSDLSPVGTPLELKGTELGDIDLEYFHPFIKNRKGKIYTAEFVTDDTGTGVVHIAPGHGHDDYALGYKHGLLPLSPIDGDGKLTEEAGLDMVIGDYVFDANPKIVSHLKDTGKLFASEEYVHSYPHCWRSKTPIIFRSVKQWFIKVDAFRNLALDEIEKINWVPSWGKNRIKGSVESRQDWCISRQRAWGIPIPVFYKGEDEYHLDHETIMRFADMVEKEGTDIWFDSNNMLSKKLGLKEGWVQGTDTLDVWIDSGSSYQAVAKKRLNYPADLYLEGSDQHRGWFQSSLLLSCATEKRAPYKAVLTHGFVVDGDGKKMSKSLGNVISPEDIIKKYGADILRLWVSASDYNEDIRLSETILKGVTDAYRKIRNTFRYLLANLSDFHPDKNLIDNDKLLPIDKWILTETYGLVDKVTEEYENYRFHKVYRYIYDFCIMTLSATYLDIMKDRLYTDGADWPERRSAQTAMYHIIHQLVKIIAPIMPFSAEDVWRHFSWKEGEASVHFSKWPSSDKRVSFASKDKETLSFILDTIRPVALKELEEMRSSGVIGSSLEARVDLCVSEKVYESFFKNISKEEIQFYFIVSKLNVKKDSSLSGHEFNVEVFKAEGKKCSRCWKLVDELTKDDKSGYQDICDRCVAAIK